MAIGLLTVAIVNRKDKAASDTAEAAAHEVAGTAFEIAGTGVAMGGPAASFALVVSGALLVGADTTLATYDCWKPVLHDLSEKPSNGMYLHDLVTDSRILNVQRFENPQTGLPEFMVQNIWNEVFRIHMFYLPDCQLVAHADMFSI